MTAAVTVVMCTFNEPKALYRSIASVLDQAASDLELVIVNDGSTDGSGRILDDAAFRDPRLKVVHKRNEGLTKALVEGCAVVSAPWIARQDADDLSLPGRLRVQSDRAHQSDIPVLVACGAMYRTPEGLAMFPALPDSDLNQKILERGESPCPHGAAFFSRAAYEAAGGYRPEFYYAQDLDLFTRLAKSGPVASVPDVLYAYTFSPHSISTHSSMLQNRFRELIRRSDTTALKKAEELSNQIRAGSVSRTGPFAGYYFIGSSLRQTNPQGAYGYFRKALAIRPWSIRTLIRLLQCSGGSR